MNFDTWTLARVDVNVSINTGITDDQSIKFSISDVEVNERGDLYGAAIAHKLLFMYFINGHSSLQKYTGFISVKYIAKIFKWSF